MRRSSDQALIFRATDIASKVASYDDTLESDIRHKALSGDVDDFHAKTLAAAAARTAYLDASRQKRDARQALSTKVARVQGAVLGKFGPESEEYAAIGGRRPSDRRRRRSRKSSDANAGQSTATQSQATQSTATSNAQPNAQPNANAQSATGGAQAHPANGSSNGTAPSGT
jgi:hypothetical protein